MSISLAWPTAWTNIATATMSDISSWEFWAHPWFALGQRYAAAGAFLDQRVLFPQPSGATPFYDAGTVTGVTANASATPPNIVLTMSLNAGNIGAWTPSGSASSTKRWVDYAIPVPDGGIGDSLCYIPRNYVVTVETDPTDPFTAFSCAITDNTLTTNGDGTGTGTLTITPYPILDGITAKFISSASDFAGKPYYIRKAGTPWITDRWIPKPNDPESWVGIDSIGGMTIDLSVAGDDTDTGESSLTYTWTATGPAPAKLTENGTNDAKSTTAMLSRAGSYVFTCTITDPGGLRAFSVVQVVASRAMTGDRDAHITITTSSPTPPDPDADVPSPTPPATTPPANHHPTVATPAAAVINSKFSWRNTDGTLGTSYAVITDYQLTTGEEGPYPLPGWKTDQWANDYEVLIYGSDVLATGGPSPLCRLTIVHNDGSNLYVTDTGSPTTGTTYGGRYSIVRTNYRGMPGRQRFQPFAWHSGLNTAYYSHALNDDASVMGFASLTVGSHSESQFDPNTQGCVDGTTNNLYDNPDATYDATNVCECANAGNFFQPYYPQTVHALQVYMQKIAGSYVDSLQRPN